MKLSLRPRHLIAGALFWLFLMSLMTPYSAGARTMLQIGDGMTLSFSEGDIDVRSGSGELRGVEISDGGEVALTADYLNIDAEGMMGDDDWYINSLLMKNALVPDCLLYTSPSPRDLSTSRMPSSA